jgi:hypothetical protein
MLEAILDSKWQKLIKLFVIEMKQKAPPKAELASAKHLYINQALRFFRSTTIDGGILIAKIDSHCFNWVRILFTQISVSVFYAKYSCGRFLEPAVPPIVN